MMPLFLNTMHKGHKNAGEKLVIEGCENKHRMCDDVLIRTHKNV